MLAVDFVRHVVADVNVTLVANSADHVVTLIHAAAKAVDVRLRGCGVFAHEGKTLHVRGGLDAG